MNKNKKYILVIDQGTTSTRTILYDNKFKPIVFDQIEIKQYFPHEGWVEHNPIEIWDSIISTINNVIKKSKINSNLIASIGIANQRETSIIWDKKSGKPIYNAIVWQDRRTSEYCEKITESNISISTTFKWDF